MKDKDLVVSLIKKRDEVGYKGYNSKDTENLTEYFNFFMEKIYDNIMWWLDEDTLHLIYPEIYDYLSSLLENNIKYNISSNNKIGYKEFFSIFHKEAENILKLVIKNHSIDFFSEPYILSNANLNDLGIDILKESLCATIANNIDNEEVKKRRDYICSKHGISKIKYNSQVFKNAKEIWRVNKIKVNEEMGKSYTK